MPLLVSKFRILAQGSPFARRKAGHRRAASWKCSKWFVANCDSYPWASRIGFALIPAVFTKKMQSSIGALHDDASCQHYAHTGEEGDFNGLDDFVESVGVHGLIDAAAGLHGS